MTNIASIFNDAHLRSYPKGQILLYQGERTNNIFLIKSGHVKVYDITAQGVEKLIVILGPDDLFPLVWTFNTDDALHYFYETYDDTAVCVMPRNELMSAIDTSHEITKQLLQYFVERTKELTSRVECIEATSAKHKVAQVLSYLATAHGENIAKDTFSIRLQITHQSIANMAGITRETASIQLKELETEKMFKNTDAGLVVHTDRINSFLEQE